MPSLHVIGKGRRERILPLWQETARAVRRWIAVRPAKSDPQLFLSAGGQAMTRSGFEYILRKHAATAAQAEPSIAAKRVTPHVLRHSCAMHTLQATGDVRKVSLWLGHASVQTTEMYLRAAPGAGSAQIASSPASVTRSRIPRPSLLRQIVFNAHGGKRCISMVAYIAPRLCAKFQEATLAGDFRKALELQYRLMPLHRAAFAEPNPCPIKFALSLLGKFAEDVRSPLVAIEEPTREKMRGAMRHAGLLN